MEEDFIKAIEKHNVGMIRDMIYDGFKADEKYPELEAGYPLNSAILMSANLPIVRCLVEEGQADIHARDDLYNSTCLIGAVQQDKLEVVEYLADQGAEVDDYDESGSALWWAAFHQRLDIADFLLSRGAAVHKDDLKLACEKGNLDMARLLVDKGKGNVHNERFLHSALSFVEVMKYLIKKGVNIDEVDDENQTAIFKACQFGYEKAVKLLIKKKANIRIRDANGMTALMAAAQSGYNEIVKILVEEARADWKRIDKDGKTALDHAREKEHEDVIEYLLGLFNSETDFKDYRKSKKLGVGCFGTTYIYTNGDRDIAVKEINQLNSNAKDKFVRDVKKLGSHENVMKYFKFKTIAKDTLIIYMDLCDTNLKDFVEEVDGFKDDDAIDAMLQVSLGLEFIHSAKIIHGNLKPQNVLINKKFDKTVYKITDFGLSQIKAFKVNDEDKNVNNFMAPEVMMMEETKIAASADIFSVGVMFYWLMVWDVPFEFTKEVCDLAYDAKAHIKRNVPVAEAHTILRAMLKRDPKKRAKIQEVISNMTMLLDID